MNNGASSPKAIPGSSRCASPAARPGPRSPVRPRAWPTIFRFAARKPTRWPWGRSTPASSNPGISASNAAARTSTTWKSAWGSSTGASRPGLSAARTSAPSTSWRRWPATPPSAIAWPTPPLSRRSPKPPCRPGAGPSPASPWNWNAWPTIPATSGPWPATWAISPPWLFAGASGAISSISPGLSAATASAGGWCGRAGSSLTSTSRPSAHSWNGWS